MIQQIVNRSPGSRDLTKKLFRFREPSLFCMSLCKRNDYKIKVERQIFLLCTANSSLEKKEYYSNKKIVSYSQYCRRTRNCNSSKLQNFSVYCNNLMFYNDIQYRLQWVCSFFNVFIRRRLIIHMEQFYDYHVLLEISACLEISAWFLWRCSY